MIRQLLQSIPVRCLSEMPESVSSEEADVLSASNSM